jgi:DNA-binding MarR family transcriptional regulator
MVMNRARIRLLIEELSRLRRAAIDRQMESMGLSFCYWRIFSILHRSRDSREPLNLLSELLDSEMDLNGLPLDAVICEAEKQGFVVVHPSDDGRGRTDVCLTPKGTASFSRMESIAEAIDEQSLRGISRRERLAITVALRNMRGYAAKIGRK